MTSAARFNPSGVSSGVCFNSTNFELDIDMRRPTSTGPSWPNHPQLVVIRFLRSRPERVVLHPNPNLEYRYEIKGMNSIKKIIMNDQTGMMI